VSILLNVIINILRIFFTPIYKLLRTIFIAFNWIDSPEVIEQKKKNTMQLLCDADVDELTKFKRIRKESDKFIYNRKQMTDHLMDVRTVLLNTKDEQLKFLVNYLEALVFLLNE